MARRKCTECRIRSKKKCRWVNERNTRWIGECITNMNWGGACATCNNAKRDEYGTNPNYGNGICDNCLKMTHMPDIPGTRVDYFLPWKKRMW